MEEVKITKLDIKTDPRGWFIELIKFHEPVKGQIYITVAKPGITKGNHYHTRKKEIFIVIKGNGLLVLRHQKTNKEQQIHMGEGNMVAVEIPPNVAHGIKNMGNEDMFLLAYISEIFNPEDPDTFPMEVIK